jgi:splicing factor 3B subunit 1
METPSTAMRDAAQGQQVPMTPEQYQDMRLQKEMWERNRPLTDEELDAMLPSEKEGYKVRRDGPREGNVDGTHQGLSP